MDLEDMLEGLSRDKEEKKVIKTIKMTPKMKAAWEIFSKKLEVSRNVCLDLTDKTGDEVKKSKILSREFWGRIEVELNDFEHNLSVNEDTLEIEVRDR